MGYEYFAILRESDMSQFRNRWRDPAFILDVVQVVVVTGAGIVLALDMTGIWSGAPWLSQNLPSLTFIAVCALILSVFLERHIQIGGFSKDVIQRLDLIGDQISLAGDLRSLGVTRVYRDRGEIKFSLVQYVEKAEPGSEVKILGISLATFSDYSTWETIRRKLVEGCRVKLLILDPSATSSVKQRAQEESQDYEDLLKQITTARDFYVTQIRLLPPELRGNIQIGYYVSTPSHFILCTSTTMIVSPYLAGKRGFFCPHFEFETKGGGIYSSYAEHFDYLWNLWETNSQKAIS